jgi:hypothetical protein
VPGFGELGDRLDGKPRQALEHTGADGEPLVPPTIVINPTKSTTE